MKKKNLWVNHGSNELPSYDFLFPKEISFDELSNYQSSEIKLLETNKERMISSNRWLDLISQLPYKLYLVLVSEINHGNIIKNIGQINWPNKGSIVIQMIKSFQIENRIKFDNVNWQYLNDPHYCQEELSQKMDDAEHLIIY